MKQKVINEHSVEDWAHRVEILQIFSMPNKDDDSISLVVSLKEQTRLGLLALTRKDLLEVKAGIFDAIDIAFNNLDKQGSKQKESLN